MFNSSSCYSTHSNSYVDIGGEKSPLISLVRGVGWFCRKDQSRLGGGTWLFIDGSLVAVPGVLPAGWPGLHRALWFSQLPLRGLPGTKCPQVSEHVWEREGDGCKSSLDPVFAGRWRRCMARKGLCPCRIPESGSQAPSIHIWPPISFPAI